MTCVAVGASPAMVVPHAPDLVGVVKAAYTVHRLPVVPDDKIVKPPLMNVDEFRLG